jgi:hypothetical protein
MREDDLGSSDGSADARVSPRTAQCSSTRDRLGRTCSPISLAWAKNNQGTNLTPTRQLSGQIGRIFDAIALPDCVQNELRIACKRRRISAAFSGEPTAALITIFSSKREAEFELDSSPPGGGIALADWRARRLEAVQRAYRWRSRMRLALSLARGDIMLVHIKAGSGALKRFGAQLSSSNTICSVLPNSPAGRAGLQLGDKVEAVNGRVLVQHKDGLFPRSACYVALGSVLASHAPDEVVAVRIRLHYSTISSRIRLLEAKALAQASHELSGDFDFSLVGRRLDGYHSPPSVAVSEAAGSGQPPISTAARDAFLAHSCERLQRHGFGASHLPSKLSEWLRGAGGRQFIEEQRSILQGLEARDTHAREMAWLVRVVQIQLREKAPQVLQKDVGADELTPLLEQVVVATRPQHGWQVRAKLQVLDGHMLLLQPNLAAAVDGWEVALAGVEGQAIDCWRRASCEAAFWSAVVAHARPRACASLRGDAGGRGGRCCAWHKDGGWAWLLADCTTPLPTLAAGLLRRVAKEEVVAWNFAPPGRYLEVRDASHDALTLRLHLQLHPTPNLNPYACSPNQVLQDSVCALFSLPAAHGHAHGQNKPRGSRLRGDRDFESLAV